MPTQSTYNYLLLRRILNTKIHGNLAILNANDTNIERDLINSSVRIALSEIEFRGNIREVLLTPNLMDKQWDYELPNDVKADNIIGLSPQNTDSRSEFETYDLVPSDEFDRRKKIEKGIFTIVNDDLTRKLRISADVEDETLVISDLDNVNDPDTWVGFGNTIDSNIKTDADNYIQGNGSIRFSDTLARVGDSWIGIQNRNIGTFDISPYLSRGSLFIKGRLDTGDTGIKNINIRLGSDSSNYYTFTDSNQNDCSPFQTNWNTLRLNANSKIVTGTPIDTATNYVAIYWTRDSGTHLDTDFGFDYLIAKKGKYYNLSYYTRYIWQDTAFGLAENSSSDAQSLLVQNDELEIIIAKMAELANEYLRNNENVSYYRNQYIELKANYLLKNPVEASVKTSSRYNFIHNEKLSQNNDS